MPIKALITSSLSEGIVLRQAMLGQVETIAKAGHLWIDALQQGGKIFFAGNGGSAADAQHLAAELIGRFERLNGYPALALTVDTSTLTALGNDFGFDEIYSRQLMALGSPQDLLIAISTSGSSPNIVKAAETAHLLGMKVVGMTGQDQSTLDHHCHVCIKVPSLRTCRVQEIHLSLGHIWCEMVESALPPAQPKLTLSESTP